MADLVNDWNRLEKQTRMLAANESSCFVLKVRFEAPTSRVANPLWDGFAKALATNTHLHTLDLARYVHRLHTHSHFYRIWSPQLHCHFSRGRLLLSCLSNLPISPSPLSNETFGDKGIQSLATALSINKTLTRYDESFNFHTHVHTNPFSCPLTLPVYGTLSDNIVRK